MEPTAKATQMQADFRGTAVASARRVIIPNSLEMNPSKGGRMAGDDEVLTVKEVSKNTPRSPRDGSQAGQEGEDSELSNRHRVAIPQGSVSALDS